MSRRVLVGVSLKMYFTHREALRWFDRIAEVARTHAAVSSRSIDVFVAPTYLQIESALGAFAGVNVAVGAQDASAEDSGAFTGEVSPAELAEMGVSYAEIGHGERRRLFGDTDEIVAAKTRAALRNGLVPVLCVGENKRLDVLEAAASTVAQLDSALDGAAAGPVVVAYEPVWAIGATEPAPTSHIATVSCALHAALEARPGRAGSSVIYGGSARPGLLRALGDTVDGVFLGRFAHDPEALSAVLDEAADLASARGSE